MSINIKELTEQLIKEWLEKLDYLDEIKRDKLYEIACNYYGDLSFLFDINRNLKKNEYTCGDVDKNLFYEKDEDDYILIYNNCRMLFTYEQLKEIIYGMIDILDNIYPLGTVVELKKEYLQKIISKDNIEKAEVVIVSRFLFHNKANLYFQYSGVVYPIGFLDEGKAIHFTSSLIDKVIYTGYSDEKEDAYIYLIKKELIVDKKMHSFGFATENERREYQDIVGVKNNI